MIPDRNLLRRHCDDAYSYGACFLAGGGGGGGGGGGDFHFHGPGQMSTLKPAFSMADDEPSPAPEDEHRGRRVEDGDDDDDDDEEDDTSTSGGWLRLGPASALPSSSSSSSAPAPAAPAPATRLEQLSGWPPPSSSSSASVTYPVAWPLKPGRMVGGFRAPTVAEMAMTTAVPWMSHPHPRQDMPSWGRWGHTALGGMVGAGPTVVLPPAMPEFVARQFMHPVSSSSPPPPPPTGAPSRRPDVRVVSPPRRPQSGVWITLQAMRDQGREPFLPQIPKSYLRIKDGRMTIWLLTKYLVSKLGLEDESEVEIACRGQVLPPSLTLQTVRDNVWRSRDRTPPPPPPLPPPMTTLLQDSRGGSPQSHIMMLEYGRSSYASAFKARV